MTELALSVRTRLVTMMVLTALAVPFAAHANPDCYKDCNDFSLDVYEKTGDRAFADMAFDKCVANNCTQS